MIICFNPLQADNCEINKSSRSKENKTGAGNACVKTVWNTLQD
jgi:hypothetical protein